MEPQKGFIQIPILLIIIAGIVLVGGAGYFGVVKYQGYEKEKQEAAKQVKETQDLVEQQQKALAATASEGDKQAKETQDLLAQQQKALEEAKSEIGALKSQKPQVIERVIEVPPITPPQKSSSGLSNSEIIAKVKPAVVYIQTRDGSGSGMIIESAGYVLTNAHVVTGVNTANIKLSDGRLFLSNVVGRDENFDLAVLKIDGNNFPTVVLGDSSENILKQGDEVFTLGYPFGLEGDVSFKEGTISRRISDGTATYLETSAEIHPGNSGGPLVNKYGEVVGVNSASYGKSIAGVQVGETIKWALPINLARGLIPLLKGGRNIVLTVPTPIPMPQPTTPGASCPIHSHESASDTSKCTCDTGYIVNSTQDACILATTPTPVPTPTPATPSPVPTPTPTPTPAPQLTTPPPAITAQGANLVSDDFSSYANNSIVGQGSWSQYGSANNFVIEDTSAAGSKVVHAQSGIITKMGGSLSDGRQAVYIKTINRQNWGTYADGNIQVRVTKGSWGSPFAAVSFKKDGNVAYYDSKSDAYKSFDSYNDNEWTLLEFEWQSSNATARYRVNNGTWTDWIAVVGGATDFDSVGLSVDGSGNVYLGSLY